VANKLQILSNGDTFDLFEGEAERFYITYQIHDLSNLQTRNGDFSRRVSLPLTSRNKDILGAALPTISRFDSVSVGTIPCEILVNDMPALSDSYFVIDTQEENSVTIQIFGGISKFYSDVPDLPISALSFTAFDWDSTGITSKTNTTTGVVIPDAQWVTNQSYRLAPIDTDQITEMNEAGFFMYCKSILDKIFEGFTNLTFDTSAMDAQYSKYAVACAMPLLHDQYTNGDTITTTINPQDYFPDISQRDFIREIFKLQNIVAVEANNVVTLKYFKGLETATSQNLVLNTDNTKTIYNTFKTYSQTNELKYSDDDIVERTDADSSFLVNSETLPLSGTIIQSKFFPCDVGETISTTVRAAVGCWEVESFRSDYNFHFTTGTTDFTVTQSASVKIGDLVSFGAQGYRRIVTLNADADVGTVDRVFTSTGTWQRPFYLRYKANNRSLNIVSVEDQAGSYSFKINGELILSNNPYKRAEFTTAMKWDNLKTEYYQLLVDSMEKPFIIKAWINIPTISLLTLNPLAPVYVEDYNAYFYINKLEQWRLNTSARVELIEIPI